jgi:hypothetical protein
MVVKKGICSVCKESVPLNVTTGKTLEHHRGTGRTQYRCTGSKKPPD